ncbi:ABC transporter ATP-binding protein [Aeromicrobium phragmitis]|uniref:ABC transporter ATP-binding protein n=1 Tax=Aeromicrobium phragmitis TaxID=2478914 RepID=A0A3L8PQN3_9ACTN|nr:ABC transporter ATP-binding protein [Aeromicrobium phragmitis]RLV57504.1 ABC transporter ATP-binding protein [Aeromicrobium phragmitis]
MIVLDEAGVVAPDPGGDVVVLRPTTLTLTERRIAVIGANGSGKSTFARMINGLVEPTEGRVLVDELDVQRDGAAVRRHVGFVFTDPAAQLVMPTVVEDVALSLRRHHRDARERRAAAQRVLDRFGLGELADRSVHTLSGGQKQLLALASVLATEPSVLVADEPTTLLDLRNSRAIGDLLMALEQQVVVVTHDLELAARCDRVLVIDDARVVYDGSPADAVSHYRSLV